MKTLRWGILGTGRIAHQFVSDFAHVANGRVTAVASRNPRAAGAFATVHGIERAHGDYVGLFEDEGVDAVYIATPHSVHLENSSAALRAGKAVLCEKPLTTTPEECLALMGVARETGAYLLEGLWTYFLPAIRQAREWLDAGRIGRLRHIKADFGYPLLPYDPARREYDVRLGGGCLLEMGIYPIALAWLFTGLDPIAVRTVSRRAANGVEDDLAMLFEYADCTATLGTSFRCKLQNWAYLIGEDGYVAIPDFWRASECHLYRLDTRIESYSDQRLGLGFSFETMAVANDLLAGRTESPLVPHSTSLRLQQHMQRVRDAMR